MIKVGFYNNNDFEVWTILETSSHLTKSLFAGIVNELFRKACEGCEYNSVSAVVSTSTHHYVIDAITYVEGSSIFTNIFVNGTFLRRMTIAD